MRTVGPIAPGALQEQKEEYTQFPVQTQHHSRGKPPSLLSPIRLGLSGPDSTDYWHLRLQSSLSNPEQNLPLWMSFLPLV